jgi:serine/threonine protein kinase/formylglycine-generating enzyme required for sulfatase activity
MATETDTLVNTVVLDRYRIIRQIGAGGMGVVYEAEHTNLGTRHAVKALRSVMDLPKEAFEEMLIRFQREAKICASIRHPNMVHVSDFGTHENMPFLIMEYIEGLDLGQVVEATGAMGEPKSLAVLRDVASAIGQLHSKGVIHRDLKPPNVMVQNVSGRVVLMDLGIAKEENSDVTQNVIGTPAYMAPEQMLDASAASPASDIYSLGATFYAILFNKAPFSSPNALALMQQAREGLFMHGSLAGVAKTRDNFSMTDNVESLLRDMTAYEERNRLCDTREIQERVTAALGDGGDSTELTQSILATGTESGGIGGDETLMAGAGPGNPTPVRVVTGGVGGSSLDATMKFEGNQNQDGPQTGERRSLAQLTAQNSDYSPSQSAESEFVPLSRGSPIGMIIVILILLGGGGAGAFFYLKKEATAPGETTKKVVTKGVQPPPPVLKFSDLPTRFEIPLEGTDALEMLIVKPGEFKLGSEDGGKQEGPIRTIELTKPYYVARYEVTVGQMAAFFRAKKMDIKLSDLDEMGMKPKEGTYEPKADWADRPVRRVSHIQARAFCSWLTKSTRLNVELPGEVEWEYAARGPESFTYPWGNEWATGHAHAGPNAEPASVGSYPDGASWCSVEDMAGNVFEWCADKYIRERYMDLDKVDPGVEGKGSSTGNRVIKGGGYNQTSPDYGCRLSYRNGLSGNGADHQLGFRVKVRATKTVLEFAPKSPTAPSASKDGSEDASGDKGASTETGEPKKEGAAEEGVKVETEPEDAAPDNAPSVE